jgi:NADH-quinone oxidoreductase subunit G
VLGNLLALPNFEYQSSEEVRDELKARCDALVADTAGTLAAAMPSGQQPGGEWVDIPLYQGDVFVRRSPALAKTKDGQMARAVI